MKNTLTIAEIRRRNLQLLLDESEERTAVALAARCGTTSSYLSQIQTQFPDRYDKPREIGTRLARKLEKGCNKPEGWMDTIHDDIDPNESELVNLFRDAMNDEGRALLLQQARMISKIGK